MQDEKPTANPADEQTETPQTPVAESAITEPPVAEVVPAAVEAAAATIEQAAEAEVSPTDTTAEEQPAPAEPAADAADRDEEPADDAPPADETEPVAPEPERKPRPNDRPARSRNDTQQREVDRVLRRFHACGRCSTLVSACGVVYGRDTVRDAAAATRDGWLSLECDRDVLRLLNNAYSISADILSYYIDSSCPECRRRFTFIDRTDEEKGCELRLSL